MCYDVVSKTTPPYLFDLLRMYIPPRSLRSSAHIRALRIPISLSLSLSLSLSIYIYISKGNALFPIWALSHGINSVRYAATKSQFKTQLKTTLFFSGHGPDS